MFGYILELPDISRPPVLHEQVAGGFVQAYGRHLILLSKVRGKFAEQQMDIIFPIPQGWQVNFHSAEAIVQVFPKFSVPNRFLHVLIGRGHDPDVCFLDLGGSHLQEFPVFQHAQQTHLCGQGQFPYLIQEDSSPVRFFKIATPGLGSSGKRPFFMPEEFAVYRPLGIAPQFTAIYLLCFRCDKAWMILGMDSFPTPLSP